MAEAVKPEYRGDLGNFSQIGNGMGPSWVIHVFSTVQRFDAFRSKAKYLSIGRERFKGVIFPVPSRSGIIVILGTDYGAESTELYELVIQFVERKLTEV